MPDSVNITDYIEIGDASCFLAGDDMAERRFFNGGSVIKQIPESIYAANLALKSAFERNDGTPDANSMANYLYSLCGKYIGKAKSLLGTAQGVQVGSGGGTDSGQLTISKDFPQFIVGQAGSLMNPDGISFNVADASAAPAGTVKPHVYTEGVQEGSGVIDRLSYTAQWIPNTGYSFTFNQAPNPGTLVNGDYPITVNLTSSQTAGTTPQQDLNYYAVLLNGETKSLVNTSGQIFLIATNSVHNISFTLFCTDASSKATYVRQVNLGVQNLANVLSVLAGSNDFVIADPFGGALTVTYDVDQAFQGFRINVTGIANKTINCVAKFTDTPIDV